MCSGLLLFVLLLPSTALAAGEKVADQESLLLALESGKTAITFTADISTDTNILIPEGTAVDLDGYTWTVDGGTVAVSADAVVGGSFTASKKGTIRILSTVALESAAAGEPVKRVTYTDGETDDAALYIADFPLDANGTVRLYLKRGKTVARVTTAQAVYRLGTADGTRLSRVYSLTYNLDGGRIEGGTNPTEYTAADAPITLVNPTREGYTFLGWTGTGIAEPTEIVTIPMGSTGSRSYTALWEAEAQPDTPSAGDGSGGRPSGGGAGSNFGGLSGSIGSSVSEETEKAEEEAQTEVPTAASPAADVQQSERRLSVASSSVETSFSGARPILEPVSAADSAPGIDRTRLFLGAGLILVAIAGAILLKTRREP